MKRQKRYRIFMSIKKEQHSYAYDVKKELLRVSCKTREEIICEWVFYFLSCGQPRYEGSLDCFPDYCVSRRKDVSERISGLMRDVEILTLTEKINKKEIWHIYPVIKDHTVLLKLFRNYLCEKSLDQISSDTKMRRSALRGLFLACGTLVDPNKFYRLEFAHKSTFIRNQILLFLHAENILPHLAKRKENTVLYIKNSEEISRFLALAGAHNALLEFENIRIHRELRGKVNRVVNCDSANTRRQADAGAAQIRWLTALMESPVLMTISDELRETAVIRITNPGLSIREVGELMSPPISKSGLNHRLRRLEEIAKNEGILFEN